MNTTNNISAIMALYNGEKHIRESISSVFSQTYSVAELIVVDDGSSDSSLNEISEFLNENKDLLSKIKIISQVNSGQGAARNRGVVEASGDLIAFIDQDDTWEPNHCEVLLSNLDDNPQIGWVFSDFNWLDVNSRIIQRQYLVHSDYRPPLSSVFSFISQDLMMLPSASLLRKNAFISVGGFDTQFRGYEDDDLFFRLLMNGWDFNFCTDGSSNYRMHPNNSSGNNSFLESRMKFFKKYYGYFVYDPEIAQKFDYILTGRIVEAYVQDAQRALESRDKELFNLSTLYIKNIYFSGNKGLKTNVFLFLIRFPFTFKVYVLLSKLRSKFKFLNKAK